MLTFGFVVVAALACCVILAAIMVAARPDPFDETTRRLRRAMDQADNVFRETVIQMEEAVGRRAPGEIRVKDGLRASWRDW